MNGVILNERNYKIWSNLVMGELEEAKLEHTVSSDSTSTESTTEGEGTTTINEISEKDNAKAKRIIYKHLNEQTWEKVEDIDTAYELWSYLKKILEELVYNGEELRIFIADFENLWNKYSKSVRKVEPLSSKHKKSEKLYYFRNSFKVNYPEIYERLTYSVAKEEDIKVMKQIIELTIKDKQNNDIKENKPKVNKHYYDAQPINKRKCFLCGSSEHILNQCNMRDSFNNWKRTEQIKLKEKEDKGFNINENYNIETDMNNPSDNNSF
ncbi:hypothetical protein PIROE2DRAFT_1796 [Piromyces sp. E2]|nr:hypothetical protein PIROE2DRAFT_1796 [Piromyces sp. E2]|eukprot:OUM70115.1 hypothetical protein PIROE2DRAFT_1796 [Piromyces sp. E2]